MDIKEQYRKLKQEWRNKGNNREKEKQYQKEWRLKNKERKKEYNRKDYLKRKSRYLELAKKRAIENKEEIKHYMYVYNHKRHLGFKLKVLKHYSKGKMECECCGERIIDFLTIDHKSNDGAKHRKTIGSAHVYKWLIDNNFPEGYSVLCMNCNFGKGLKYNKGICPHKKGELI